MSRLSNAFSTTLGPGIGPATSLLNENAAAQFLNDLRDSVDDNELAQQLLQSFTQLFQDLLSGARNKYSTRQEAANLIADEAPIMLEDFATLFEACCHSTAWAGAAPIELVYAAQTNTVDAPAVVAAAPEDAAPRDADTAMRPQLSGAPVTVRRASTLAAEMQRQGTVRVGDWQTWASKLVPEGRGTYAIWFTIVNIAAMVGLFSYMMGDYAMWLRMNQAALINQGYSDAQYQTIVSFTGEVPEYLKEWLAWGFSWQTFSFDFLKAWGGRWTPGLANGDWWLWFTSIYIHQNLQHIVSNTLLFVALSVHLELNYGWWRLLLVWLVSGVGANFISATFENSCTLLVGASGAVFGFIGLFVADLIVNFESMSRPIVRGLVILLFIIFFVVTAVVDSGANVSHASHIGGLICGLFPSLLFIPNLKNRRLKAVQRKLAQGQAAGMDDRELRQQIQTAETAQRNMTASFWTRHFVVNPLLILAGLVIIVVYIALPIYLYTNKFKQSFADCPGFDPASDGARVLFERAAFDVELHQEFVRRG